jgi:hypothetical protein
MHRENSWPLFNHENIFKAVSVCVSAQYFNFMLQAYFQLFVSVERKLRLCWRILSGQVIKLSLNCSTVKGGGGPSLLNGLQGKISQGIPYKVGRRDFTDCHKMKEW